MTTSKRFAAALALSVCMAAGKPAYASPLAYIANADDNTLSLIDTDTNEVVKTIFNLPHPVYVTVNAAGSRLYVVSIGNSPPILQVFNTQTNTNIANVLIGVFGTQVNTAVLHPTQPFLYIGASPDKVFVLDTATNAFTTPITVPVSGGDTIGGIALDPSGTTLYATKLPGGDISVIDVGTGLETTTITGGGLYEAAVDPTGAYVYAVHETIGFAHDEIVVSDTATNTVVDSATFAGCTGLRGLTFDATGATLYASCGGSGAVAVIDTATLTATLVPVGSVPTGTSLTPDGAYLYVANAVSNSVSVLDTSTNTVADTVTVGDEPTSLGKFIGPNFVCGNGTLEPGEGCDDGNVADGDGCNASCYIVQDMVVSLIKPAAFQIDSGITAGGKRMNAKVRNAGSTAHSVSMVLNTACGAYGYTGFKPGISPFPVEAGQSVGGDVIVAALANSIFQANYESPIRCRYTLTAYAATDFTVDATPWNNVATFDVDILDLNQSEMSAVHETTISVVKPVKLKIKDGATSVTKKIKLKVGSADYLPAPEDAASHPVSVSGSSDCTALSIGTPTFRGNPSVDVGGGDTESGTVSLTVTAADVYTPDKSNPVRCVATLTAAGPPGDSMPGNDAASVVVDVIDLNDF